MIRALCSAPIAAAFLAFTPLQASAIDIHEVRSPGGITAWLVEDHSIPFTALSMAFKGGASMDAEGKRGAVNLMTATLEEGAGVRDAVAFAEAVEETGAVLNFNASDDAVSVTARLLTDTRDGAADLLSEALFKPRFDTVAVDRVRGQVQAIIRAEATDPGSIAQKELAHLAWGDHPYGTSINGTAQSVATLTPDDLRTARERVMGRDRLVVAAAGDITPADLGALLDRVLGSLPEKASAPLPGPASPQLTGGVTVIPWDSPQTVVQFAAPGLPMDDPEYFAAFVGNYILGGGGFSSRMTDEIREKRGLTYGVSTALSTGLFGDLWVGGMATANANTGAAVDLARTEWGRLADGVTEKELADAKTYLTGEYPLRFDGNRKIADILAGMQLVGLPREYVNTRNSKIEAVRVDDVAKVAKRLLEPEKLRFVLVGKPDGVTSTNP
ncbi:insulinase family protein [Paracoccus suum]|uniref:Insulinase family protein n=1 Tax=Paracoccus suum TaxID=2259340 RepID=A0A344PHK1_9RHOB|nr:pitrilysin family protein [Paracoccus suum]AXC48856.1 insulinase family protein [Paracoccus suum]